MWVNTFGADQRAIDVNGMTGKVKVGQVMVFNWVTQEEAETMIFALKAYQDRLVEDIVAAMQPGEAEETRNEELMFLSDLLGKVSHVLYSIFDDYNPNDSTSERRREDVHRFLRETI